MNDFKRQCQELRRAGHTLTEITKITGRPKTSIYSHIHNIPLSSERKQSIYAASGARAKLVAALRRGKSDRLFSKFINWNNSTVNAVSHLIFDGSISRTSCIYNNRNRSLLVMVENSMKEVYAYEPKRYFNEKTGVSRIGYFNVALSSYLKLKSEELLKGICTLSSDLKREFIRSFFDDEGCIDFRPKQNRRQIRGYQKDNSILFLIQKLLKDFNIESRVIKPNEVVITGKENLEKFQREINFSHGVKLNENRSNSIWKKPLEKRYLLDQAIKSFRV